MNASACCEHEKFLHIIGAEEDADEPDCPSVPHASFCMECDEDDEDHEWVPVLTPPEGSIREDADA